MACLELLRVQAYFDGELDAGASLDIERHTDSCPECMTSLQELKTSRGALHQQGLYRRANPQLRSRIAAALDRESDNRQVVLRFIPRQRPFWLGAGSGVVATAAAAVFALFLVSSEAPNVLVGDLMSAHLRSLLENHLIDVASSDQHTVKPWFAGHAEVSPPTIDFPKEDFRLVGGRLDYVDGKRVPVVVYRHGAHVINVFAWAKDDPVPSATTRNGYHFVFWQSGDLVLCAVSDAAMDELNTLARLLKEPISSSSAE